MRWVAVVGTAVVLLAVVFFGAHAYTDWAYAGMAAGMTRAEVDRHLWEFSASVNTTYNSLGPGETMIDYELLGLGNWTRISVIFKADGRSIHPIPMFDN